MFFLISVSPLLQSSHRPGLGMGMAELSTFRWYSPKPIKRLRLMLATTMCSFPPTLINLPTKITGATVPSNQENPSCSGIRICSTVTVSEPNHEHETKQNPIMQDPLCMWRRLRFHLISVDIFYYVINKLIVLISHTH
jgi:hypothetical protein